MKVRMYRKKPVIVEATQWFQWMDRDQSAALGVVYDPVQNEMVIATLEGPHLVRDGDWIITGVAGERYPCKPEIFEKTYEPVEESEGQG